MLKLLQIFDVSNNTSVEFRFEIAGIVFSATSKNPAIPPAITWVKDHYGAFISNEAADVNINLEVDKNFRNIAHNNNASRLVLDKDFLSINSKFINTEGDLKKGEFKVLATPGFGLGDFLRTLTSLILLERNGFLLHASGVIDKEKAYVFCGPSESGKTTIAELANGRDVLSDETIAVSKRNDSCYAYATPFFGKLRKQEINTNAEIKSLFFIHKSNTFYHKTLNRKEAVMRIFPEIILRAINTQTTGQLLDIIGEFCKSIPCYDLYFKPETSIWEYIDGID